MQQTPASSHLRNQIFASAPGLEVAETLFDTLRDVLFCAKDTHRRYVAANQAFVRAAGLKSRTVLLGKGATDLFPAALAASYEQQDAAVLATGNPVQNKMELVTRADGAIGWFLSQKVAVRDLRGHIIALAGISRDLSTPAEQGASLVPLADAMAILQKDLSRPVRVMKLAKSAGLSVSQFERRVREMTGLSPRQLLTKARIEAAATALRETEAPLNWIAIDCGFYDQASFSRQFREATGTTPGRYRRVFQEEAE